MLNERLPINSYEEEILSAVEESPVVIITAETGSGKSTQVPQMLSRAGYEVTVTQPRRIATRTVAARVAYEMNCTLGKEVGFMTAFEKNVSEDTNILFCTDGLQLVREIVGAETNKERVLVIDEVHEWNLNIETLVAWSKLMIDSGEKIKVVIMSATLDAEALKSFYGYNTRIISVPGKLYSVKNEESTQDIIGDIARLVDDGRNILVFMPGKKEISDLICDLSFLKGKAIVLPLHGELEIEEQNQCFVQYSIPKVIVATNVAQTSITIPDIDAVIDTAVERRIEVQNGIESLITGNISKADCIQRKGRAGRVKEGVYIYFGKECYENLSEFPIPEIERLRLDQVVLRLKSFDLDAENMEFFHQPSIESIKDSKKLLVNLGALDSEGKITEIGKEMAKLPCSVRSARMLVEGKKENVLPEMIDIVSVYEAGGIKDKFESYSCHHQNSYLS